MRYMKEAMSEAENMIAAGTAPEGVTIQGLNMTLEYRTAMGDCVKNITQDAIKERHKNGMAKQWGQAVLQLLRLCLLLQYKDDKQKPTLETWKAKSGGKIKHKQQSFPLYVEIQQNKIK